MKTIADEKRERGLIPSPGDDQIAVPDGGHRPTTLFERMMALARAQPKMTFGHPPASDMADFEFRGDPATAPIERIPARERAAMAFCAKAWNVPWSEAAEFLKGQARTCANEILDAAGFKDPSDGLGL